MATLIKPASISQDTVEVGITPLWAMAMDFLCDVFSGPFSGAKPSQTYVKTIRVAGKITTGNCIIKFDESEELPSLKHDYLNPVKKQNYTFIVDDISQVYHGVFPFKKVDERTYECSVDYIENK